MGARAISIWVVVVVIGWRWGWLVERVLLDSNPAMVVLIMSWCE